jgi:hypothetical protein
MIRQQRSEVYPLPPEHIPLAARLADVDREGLRRAVQDAQADVAEVRRRYERGELTVDEVKECTRRPHLLVIAVARELERREAGG